MMTYSQARARLVAAALSYGRAWLLAKLADLGAARPDDTQKTDRALAHRLAWSLLPAGQLYMSSSPADLDWNAVYDRTDAGTGGDQRV